MNKNITLDARWIGSDRPSPTTGAWDGSYVIENDYLGIYWTSIDGDAWEDASTGSAPTGPAWDQTRIKLCGGPRDGSVVA